jgi:hypothetical protein
MRLVAILLCLTFLAIPPILSTRATASEQHSLISSTSSVAFELSTYFGGDREDTAAAVCYDSAGNLVITGSTRSTDLPLTNAQQETYGGIRDVYVLKLDSSYNVIFCTYYGGSGEEYPMDMVIDDDNNILIVGHSESDDLPVPNGLQTEMHGTDDAFVVKFDSSGTLIYGTYIGGNGANEWLNTATLDENNNLITAGVFESDDMNTTPNAFQEDFGGGSDDVVVLSLTPDGQTINFMTYFGLDNRENCAGITLDSQNNIIITGITVGGGITTEGAYQETYAGGESDAYVAKFDPNCQTLLWSTLLGGDAWDFGGDVMVDGDDNVIASGYSWSPDFPLQNELYGDEPERDDYLAKFSEDGGELLFSTLLGGDDEDRCYGMTMLTNGSVATFSMTQSTDLPTADAWQENNSGSYDAYFALYNPNLGSLLCASYIGGTRSDHGLSLDVFNDEYIALVGYTSSDDFPTSNPIQSERAGNRDAFIIVLDLSPSETLTTITLFPVELLMVGITLSIVAVVIILVIYAKKKR